MELIDVTMQNKNIFRDTYVASLKEGFVGFIPINAISQFEKNFFNYFDEWYHNKKIYMKICCENANPLGIVVYGKSTLDNASIDDAFINSIYFRKQFHGQGYAQKVINIIEQELKDEGYKKISLWCSIENERAWHFYTKNGYTPTTIERDDNLDGKIYHNFLFCKILN